MPKSVLDKQKVLTAVRFYITGTVLIGSAHGNLPGVRSAIALAAVHCASSGSLEDKVNVWSPETPENRYPTLTNTGDINNYNYQCSSWLVNDG